MVPPWQGRQGYESYSDLGVWPIICYGRCLEGLEFCPAAVLTRASLFALQLILKVLVAHMAKVKGV